jgi:hypothetical protein
MRASAIPKNANAPESAQASAGARSVSGEGAQDFIGVSNRLMRVTSLPLSL